MSASKSVPNGTVEVEQPYKIPTDTPISEITGNKYEKGVFICVEICLILIVGNSTH
jgi:hypothetical protein